MQRSRKLWRRRPLRRAAVAAQVAVTSTVTVGMLALVLDIGSMWTRQTELQVAADAAALAAASELSAHPGGDPQSAAIDSANEYAGRNTVAGGTPVVLDEDVEFGRAQFNQNTRQFDFPVEQGNFDGVRVTVKRLHVPPEEPGGQDLWTLMEVPFLFGPILGRDSVMLEATAAAVLLPRDIALVIDLSNSMCYDSALMYWDRTDGGYANTRDVWCALDGPLPGKPYIPADADSVDQTEYELDTGPTYGYMTQWGNPLVPSGPNKYSVSQDPGLWYIRKNYNTSVPAIQQLVAAAGYNAAERSALLSGSRDNNSWHWRRRVGVLLGLATWQSGMFNPAFPGAGNGDNVLDSNEVAWIPRPDYAVSWNWWDYIDWAQGGEFSRYYGLKTFTDFLMQSKPRYAQTDKLADTPEQPLRALKDAAAAPSTPDTASLLSVIDDLENLDLISLQTFDSEGRNEHALTDQFWDISDLLYERQTGHFDIYTNIGGGLYHAAVTLQDSDRRHASKVIVLMSDGSPNRYDPRSELDRIDDLDPDEREQWGSDPAAYAKSMARIAARRGMHIYTVSVGYGADRNLMQEIATIGAGEHFYAAGSPVEYTAQLEEIFRTLGGTRPVALIR